MVSTTSRGNYYKRKSKEYYEKLGYAVQLTEFMCATVIKGRCFYRKIDIFGSDGIAMNGKEIIFWNSKALTSERKEALTEVIGHTRIEFAKYPFPSTVKRQAIIWKSRQKPIIYNYEN